MDDRISYSICFESGKRCYTREQAGRFINMTKGYNHKRHTKNKQIPKRCYYCKDCGMWHLTHYSKTRF